MMLQGGNAIAAWIYLWMTFQLSFYESLDLLRRVSVAVAGASAAAVDASSSVQGGKGMAAIVVCCCMFRSV